MIDVVKAYWLKLRLYFYGGLTLAAIVAGFSLYIYVNALRNDVSDMRAQRDSLATSVDARDSYITRYDSLHLQNEAAAAALLNTVEKTPNDSSCPVPDSLRRLIGQL